MWDAENPALQMIKVIPKLGVAQLLRPGVLGQPEKRAPLGWEARWVGRASVSNGPDAPDDSGLRTRHRACRRVKRRLVSLQVLRCNLIDPHPVWIYEKQAALDKTNHIFTPRRSVYDECEVWLERTTLNGSLPVLRINPGFRIRQLRPRQYEGLIVERLAGRMPVHIQEATGGRGRPVLRGVRIPEPAVEGTLWLSVWIVQWSS